jgi:hypothetical protein
VKNRIRDGITSQKTEVDNFDIVSIFFVSIYIQIIAKTDIRGREASIPLIRVLFFDISVIATIKIALIKTFKM